MDATALYLKLALDTVVLPGAGAAAGTLAARFVRPERLRPLLFAAGIALGAVVAQAGIAGWPVFPPVDTLGWLVFVVPAATLLLAPLDLLRRPPPAWTGPAAGALLLPVTFYLLLRPLAAAESSATFALRLAALTAAGLACWSGLEVAVRRLPSAAVFAGLAASSAGAAFATVASRSALLGQLFGGLAAAFGVTALLLLLLFPSVRAGRAAVGAAVTAYAGLLVYVLAFARLPVAAAALLFAASLASLAAWRLRRAWAAVLLSTAVALAIAGAAAWVVHAARNSGSGDDVASMYD